MFPISGTTAVMSSRPARGAWIEIADEDTILDLVDVAPREGRVD